MTNWHSFDERTSDDGEITVQKVAITVAHSCLGMEGFGYERRFSVSKMASSLSLRSVLESTSCGCASLDSVRMMLAAVVRGDGAR